MLKYEEGQTLLIDKPFKWTSFDVIRRIRQLIKIKKVGHAGTLDPLATGLLIICTGKRTKKINDYMSKEKEYTGTITLGATTQTFDLECQPENLSDYHHLNEEQIVDATRQFTGNILQIPPIYSAIKQEGKRVYELARKGIDVKMEPRKVTISEFAITRVSLPVISFRVVCSTGTYIRSLANDLGAVLGCGGYLSGLCRTRIGEFELKEALSMQQFEELVKQEREDAKKDN